MIIKITTLYGLLGHAVAQLVEALRYKPEGRGVNSMEFFVTVILPAAQWPWGLLCN